MCRIMTGLVISNLIIIVVILSSVEDSGFLKNPEKTLDEVNGKKEERLTQAAEKLGNFAKIILRSTMRRREKNSARNKFQSRQDSAQDSSNSRNALLVMRIQDSTQDSIQDSSQDSIQDSSQDSAKDSSNAEKGYFILKWTL